MNLSTKITEPAAVEPRDDMEFLQSLPEEELTELVIIPLLEAMGYSEIRYTHGPQEHGKDVVFIREDPLAGRQQLAATIKSQGFNGSVSSSRSIHEIFFQIQQALNTPYFGPFCGEAHQIEQVFCITPFQISPTTVISIKEQLQALASKIRFVDGALLVSLVNKYLPGLLDSLPDPETRYLQQICNHFQKSTPLGYLGSQRRLTVQDIFIPPLLSPITKEEARYITFAAPNLHETHQLPYTIIADRLPTVVLADVGSGKTTLLHRIVIDLAEERRNRNKTKAPFPIFVPLARFQDPDLVSVEALKLAISDFVREEHNFDMSERTNGDGVSRLLLLDGFDELVGAHEVVIEYIHSIVSEGAVIVTSRPSRIPDLENFRYFRLNPFSEHNIREYLSRWFEEDSERRDEMIARIVANSHLLDLCRTPLMLTLYAILARQVSIENLPTRRTDIYRTITDLLLGEWDTVRKIRNNYSADAKRQVLEALAFDNHKRQQRRFDGETFKRIARIALRSRLRKAFRESDVQGIIHEIVFRSSMIRRTGRGWEEYEFAHLSFQEYFAAHRLTRGGASRDLNDFVADDWWRNCLLFYFGLKRSVDEIVQAKGFRKHEKRGIGLLMLEFLSEADFSDAETRKLVFRRVGAELLLASHINEHDLAVCCRLGNEVIEAIESVIVDPDFNQWSMGNLAQVVGSINSSKGWQLLYDNVYRLKDLEAAEILSIAECCISSSGQKTYSFVIELIQRLKETLPTAVMNNRTRLLARVEFVIENFRKITFMHDGNSFAAKFSAEVKALRALANSMKKRVS